MVLSSSMDFFFAASSFSVLWVWMEKGGEG
jgi:hypothetical protein